MAEHDIKDIVIHGMSFTQAATAEPALALKHEFDAAMEYIKSVISDSLFETLTQKNPIIFNDISVTSKSVPDIMEKYFLINLKHFFVFRDTIKGILTEEDYENLKTLYYFEYVPVEPRI
tara:strand:- start:383 stop:739 length:357 start_codon:yes stop_codon:yes gene_type:complete